MGRCSIQIVMGPAGSGKSTYCSSIQDHCRTKRSAAVGTAKNNVPIIHIANLDPAAEYFTYDPIFDIRDIISVEDVMTELSLGPNGALVYCMEYILEHHMEWLHDELEQMGDEDYLFLDCPGQIELYTHIPIQKRIIETIKHWGYDGHIVSVYCIDVTFCMESYKFISGSLLSMSTMIALELPHVTILTKCDLISEKEVDRILETYTSATYVNQLDQNQQSLLYINDNIERVDENWNDLSTGPLKQKQQQRRRQEDAANETQRNDDNDDETDTIKKNDIAYIQQLEERRKRRSALSTAIASIIDDYSMISYLPLNIYDEDSCDHVLYTINHTIQYGEDHDVYGADENNDYEPPDNDNDDHDNNDD